MQIKTLALTGASQKITDKVSTEYPGLVHEHSVHISSSSRGDSNVHKVTLTDDSLVELVFDDGGKWLGPPDMLEDIYPSGAQYNRGGDAVFKIEEYLQDADTSRSLSKIALKWVNIFTKKAADATKQSIQDIASRAETQLLGNIKGLMSVKENMALVKEEALDIAHPILLLLHGTASSTQGSFGDLLGTPLWTYWQQTYGKNILAFQHETLTKSPLQNAVDLIEQLPTGATLHLISHSSGGLLGEIVCRYSQQDTHSINGFSDTDIQLFKEVGQENDYQCIEKLRTLAKSKQYKVNKFIRIACPAAGTTILSKRLDYFVNIILNLLGTATGLAIHPAHLALRELLVAVIDQKNQPDVLPGLEAMKPESLFIRVLNNKAADSMAITSPVAVISGNNKKGGSNWKSLCVIISQLFYGEDNDLIVNTGSMYAGSPKTTSLQYFFDEGTNVDHFSYYKNPTTNEAILLAFKTSGLTPIKGFTPFTENKIGETNRNALLGLDGVQFSMDEPSGKRPIVVLLPGIMGTALGDDAGLIWINLSRFVLGHLSQIDVDMKDTAIKTAGIISSSYKDLADHLSSDYDVVTFSFDWRQSLLVAAKQFNHKINTLLSYAQPIKIIAHSMGGVLVRDFIIQHTDTWQKLNSTASFQLLFLGAPLGGSYRILSVLFGQDNLIKKLAMADVTRSKKELLNIFCKFPGILCLLPITGKEGHDFADINVWKKMAAFEEDSDIDTTTWPIPSNSHLQAFAEYQKTVQDAVSKGIDYGNAIYIAGKGKATPCDFRCDTTRRGKELVFLSTAQGDQSVTWETGIPPELNKKNIYYVDVPHGDLASTPNMFAGIRGLLAKGETHLFNRNRPASRSSEQLFVQPNVQDFDLSPQGIENTILGLSADKTISKNELPVKVKVSHGDLKFADYPLLAGHFKNDSILFAEKRVDELLKKLLTERHSIGLYPGDIGTSEILLTHQEKGFKGAIIVGLSEPGTLNASGLSETIEQAVARYLLVINGRDKMGIAQQQSPLGISSLIIGCGYGGLSVENSISSILEGIMLANEKINTLYQNKAKLIEHIQFIELYEDRALTCYYTIHNLCNQGGHLLNIISELGNIEKLRGCRKRINLQQSEEWWNRIEIRKRANNKGKATGMNFVLGNNIARQDQRDVSTISGTVENLISIIAAKNNWDKARARSLYELLIPHDFKLSLKKSGNIIWILDDYTAEFPWELLHDKSIDSKPLCVESGMIRQLIRHTGRTRIERINNKTALVIGDPQLNGFAPQLDEAHKEAEKVAQMLEEAGYMVPQGGLLRSNPEDILNTMFREDYKIIHLAGHGEFKEEEGEDYAASGMLIGNGIYLTSNHIAQISGSAELVFVNCCYLGKVKSPIEALYQQRYKLAANIGTQLIDNGVKAVVVAGWAIEDEAALVFAEKFYQYMLNGFTFGEAVKRARKEVYERHNDTNTWGAYQCYGDPFYRLIERETPEKDFVVAEQIEIELENLLSDLDSADPKEDKSWAELILQAISSKADASNLRNQRITEIEAYIYIELNRADKAIEKFEHLLKFNGSDYSFRAIEEYYRLRAKKLYDDKSDDSAPAFDSIIKGLSGLLHIRKTAERYTLLGSTYKKKIGFLSAASNTDNTTIKNTIIEAANAYRNAYLQSIEHNHTGTDAIYPFTNWAVLQSILVNAGGQWYVQNAEDPEKDKGPQTLQEITELLSKFNKLADAVSNSEAYFDRILPANIELCKWVLDFTNDGEKMSSITKVIERYQEIWQGDVSKSEKDSELQHLDLLQKGAVIAQGKDITDKLKELIDRLKQL